MTTTRKRHELPDGFMFAFFLGITALHLIYLGRFGTGGFWGVWHLVFMAVFAFAAGSMLMVWRRRL